MHKTKRKIPKPFLKKARERYQNFTKEEKEKGYQYYLEHKKRLPDYRRNCYQHIKNNYWGFFKYRRAISLVSMINP